MLLLVFILDFDLDLLCFVFFFVGVSAIFVVRSNVSVDLYCFETVIK